MSWKIKINGTLFITAVFTLVTLVLVLIFSGGTNYEALLYSEAGILEVTEKSSDLNIPLEGEWFFYANTFLDPNAPFESGEIRLVPDILEDDVSYGTYRLMITGLEKNTCYSFYIYDMNSAYKLYANDRLIAENGKIATSFDEEVFHLEPLIVNYNASSDTIILTLQTSNFHYTPGGLLNGIKFGKVNTIQHAMKANVSEQMILFGAILIISIYNLSLFLFNRKEYSALVFSLFTLSTSIRIPLTGERLINSWHPSVNWIPVLRIQYVAGFASLLLFVLFLYSLFKELFSKKVVIGLSAIVSTMVVLTFIMPLKSLLILDTSFGLIALVTMIYILFILVKAIKIHAVGALYSFIGISFVTGTVMLDLMLTPGTSIMPFGILMFLIFHSLVISEKFLILYKQNEILHNVAVRDAMTNLYKKTHFNTLTTAILENQELEPHHSLMFIDIDDFKFVNDTYGHDVGDDLIITLSERIIRSLRNSDIACRYGGDEFLVWLNQSKEEESLDIAKRVLKNISEEIYVEEDKISFSVSIGLSHFPKDGTTVESLISVSDQRMYEAKSKGKNQCVSN